MEKSLYDISLKITEEEYRKDPALSYSTIAKYEREGFSKLPTLFDRVESPSLTLGSAVDALITGGQEEFDNNFIVATFPKISDTLVSIVKQLFKEFADTYTDLIDIPDVEVSMRAKMLDFWAGDKWDKVRAKKVKEEEGCQNYYKLMYVAQNKTILSTETYNDVIKMVDALKESDDTAYYFQPNNPFEEVERLYQLKFKATLNGVDYRCMSDLLVVDYTNKTILPCDLKTSGKPEYLFYKSFTDWRYDIQARLYWRIIRDNLDRDPYFKDFKLLDYKFIVVNKLNLDPMVWEFPDTQTNGDLNYKDVILRDPEEIGEELSYYLKNQSKRPVDIFSINNISYWLNK